MKGTLISIAVGALAGVLLTVGSSMHASHAAASRAAASRSASSTQSAADAASRAETPATPSDQAPRTKQSR